MPNNYIEKLENLLDGVKNYRFDDMSCAEWEELTMHVLQGAIAREKANELADDLANSIWNKLEKRNRISGEVRLNENQELVLMAMRNRYHWFGLSAEYALFDYLTTISDEIKLTNIEFIQVLRVFSESALEEAE